jgi:ubiquitin-activating enzyme E1
METMGKLIKMRVCIVGIRGLGVEIAKNLILAGPKEVLLYDPDMTRTSDLGANFYLEEGHVGKVSRAEGVRTKLNELNPYVKLTVITDLEAAIKAGDLHVVC